MRRAVQRREAAVVALIDDLRAVADDVVQLRDAASAARMQELASPPGARAPRTGGWSAFLRATVSSAASHHVQLLVRRREVHGRAGAVVLAPEVRVRVHDLRGHGEAQRGAEQSGCRRVRLGAEGAPASAARSRRGARRSRRRRAGSAAAAESARCLRSAPQPLASGYVEAGARTVHVARHLDGLTCTRRRLPGATEALSCQGPRTRGAPPSPQRAKRVKVSVWATLSCRNARTRKVPFRRQRLRTRQEPESTAKAQARTTARAACCKQASRQGERGTARPQQAAPRKACTGFVGQLGAATQDFGRPALSPRLRSVLSNTSRPTQQPRCALRRTGSPPPASPPTACQWRCPRRPAQSA